MPAIRNLVAAAVAGLKPEDVTVTDLNSGRSFSGGTSDGVPAPWTTPTGPQTVLRRRLAEKILKALLRAAA